ncbi:hypothetical protein [Actinotalea caeni]|uniref:hypothetical protein n=2 Tax=Actinotalea caeni TaxID=1348467 RepID=UPI0012E2EE11|nr:hypothetical protein [Actinotalea caeni]
MTAMIATSHDRAAVAPIAPLPLTSPAIEEFLLEQALLGTTAAHLRLEGLGALDDFELDEPAHDIAVALLDSHYPFAS